MKKRFKALIRLFTGFFVYAIAIVMMINANIGLSPWDAFHQGLSIKTGITMGQASITVGFIIVVLDVVLGENIGWGTVLNMIFIGVFIDLITYMEIIPICSSLYSGVFMLIIGNFLCGIATVLYIGSGLGSGPRDGLMIALQKITNKPASIIRTIIEASALGAGFLLGGKVGIGTIISVFGLGYMMQICFNLFKFDTKDVKHTFIIDDIRNMKTYIKSKNENSPESAIEKEES